MKRGTTAVIAALSLSIISILPSVLNITTTDNQITYEQYKNLKLGNPLENEIRNRAILDTNNSCTSVSTGYCYELKLNEKAVRVTVENEEIKAITYKGSTSHIQEEENHQIGNYVLYQGMSYVQIVKETGKEGFTTSDVILQGTRVHETIYGTSTGYYKLVFSNDKLIKIEKLK